MKIQIGKIYLNKTHKYFSPCMKYYSKKTINLLNNLPKLALGIGDIAYYKVKGEELDIQEHLFILCDANNENFEELLEKAKLEDSYVDDYVYDDIHTGHQHMIIFNIPEQCQTAYHKFLEGKFSEMFEDLIVKKFFNTNRGQTLEEIEFFSDTIEILTKDKNYKTYFVEELNTIFSASVKEEEFDGELDFPILRQNEFFNYYE